MLVQARPNSITEVMIYNLGYDLQPRAGNELLLSKSLLKVWINSYWILALLQNPIEWECLKRNYTKLIYNSSFCGVWVDTLKTKFRKKDVNRKCKE